MRDKHAPHDEFVDRLEAKIGRDVRRRNALASPGAGPGSGLVARWSLKTALALATLVIVSMAIGGAVVAAAYEVQQSELRDQVASGYERRATLARERLALAEQQLKTAESQMSVGLGTQEPVLDARVKIAEAQSALKVLELQLEEIKMTSREPGMEVSSPLVSGRDFVTERWKIEMTVPTTAAEVERLRLKSLEQRVELGVISPTESEASRVRAIELETGVNIFQRKIDIRQRFLKGEYDGTMAELRLLEATTELRRKALVPKLDLAEHTAARMDERFRAGTVNPIERQEAQLKMLQLRMEIVDLDMQLAVVQKQIAQRKKD